MKSHFYDNEIEKSKRISNSSSLASKQSKVTLLDLLFMNVDSYLPVQKRRERKRRVGGIFCEISSSVVKHVEINNAFESFC